MFIHTPPSPGHNKDIPWNQKATYFIMNFNLKVIKKKNLASQVGAAVITWKQPTVVDVKHTTTTQLYLDNYI